MRLVGSKCDELRAAGAGLDRAAAGVGDDLPVERRDDVQRERRLEVGLVEAGEHPLGVGRLELRVEVDLPVLGVHEAVQALAAVGVAAVGGRRRACSVSARPGSGRPPSSV